MVVANSKGGGCTQKVKPKLALIQVELPIEAFFSWLDARQFLLTWTIKLQNYGDESSIVPHGGAEQEEDHNSEGGYHMTPVVSELAVAYADWWLPLADS
ncbi:hypothetical protein Tco_1466686 [Tanacetum coccineum]